MRVVLSKDFKEHLGQIVFFISKDSKDRARAFKKELMSKIADICFMPKRFRQNQFLGDENARDLIYKKYVVPFYIFSDKIVIIDIYKHNIPELQGFEK